MYTSLRILGYLPWPVAGKKILANPTDRSFLLYDAMHAEAGAEARNCISACAKR